MRVFHSPLAFQRHCLTRRGQGPLGFVPTMGCLHEGHFALVKRSLRECHHTVVSILVNPLQFAPGEDYGSYPRTHGEDTRALRGLKVDALFLPDETSFYERDFSLVVKETALSRGFCGDYRSSHFRGVTTVVAKLLGLCLPHRLYLGRKDYQQCLVLRRMVRDLSLPLKVVLCPTVREKDGLALSSRNRKLDSRHRSHAPLLYQTLRETAVSLKKKAVTLSGIHDARRRLRQKLGKIPGFVLQYAEIVAAPDLKPLAPGDSKAVALIAGFFGKTRLIDNVVFPIRVRI